VTRQRAQTDKAEPLAGHITGHSFRNPALLKLALTHSSLAYEKNMAQNAETSRSKHAPADNEQLEFVGDAVLGLIVAETLYRRFPHLREGDLTRLRSSLVSRKHLGEAAAAMKLGEHLYLGKGEERTGGRRKPALLANALEAVVAAIYLDSGGLDGGLPAAAAFVDQYIVQPALPALAAEIGEGGAIGDWKSALQEHLQATGAGHARYAVTAESGPDHQKCFSVELRLEKEGNSTTLSSATAATKKEAQQKAAQAAYEKLRGKAKR
jgi:ribonuclease-3